MLESTTEMKEFGDWKKRTTVADDRRLCCARRWSLPREAAGANEESFHLRREVEELERRCAHIESRLEKTNSLLQTRTEELNIAQAFVTTADRFSVSDVSHMVEQLNDDIYQCSAMLSDLVLAQPPPSDEPESVAAMLGVARKAVSARFTSDWVSRLEADTREGDTVLFEGLVQNLLVDRCRCIFRVDVARQASTQQDTWLVMMESKAMGCPTANNALA